jgi:hypothetical protein
MGTSISQRSPDTPNWKLAQDVYTDPDMPIDAALREIWRAASNENETNLMSHLARPEIAFFADLVTRATSPAEAFDQASVHISDRKVASVASDIAKRAVIQSAGTDNPRDFFFQRLFAEATNYLVSRDLPGYVKIDGKFGSISDARRFTQEMMNTAMDAVRRTPSPASLQGEDWDLYVRSVVSTIRRRQR